MLPPQAFLAQADRVLADQPDEADLRRAVSGYYYALFHLLTLAAALQLGHSSHPATITAIRRSFDHRGIRRVCDGMLNVGKARPKMLADILPAAIPAELIQVASAFIELQSARLEADYDMDTPLSPAAAKGVQALAHAAFSNWQIIQADPAAHAFLVALHLGERLTRRG